MWTPCWGVPPLRVMSTPPPSTTHPAGHRAVRFCGVEAVCGPVVAVAPTWTVMAAAGAHTAKADVVAPVIDAPPAAPTAVHDVGAAPLDAGAPLASLGYLPIR